MELLYYIPIIFFIACMLLIIIFRQKKRNRKLEKLLAYANEKLERLQIHFEGSYKNRKTQIVGKFTQGGQSFDLTLKSAKPTEPTKHIESWQGTMKAGGRSFEFQFRVLETKDKKRQVELDSFSESIGGLHVDPTFNDDGVTFEVSLTKAKFEGKYNKDKTIKGMFSNI